MSHPAGGEPEEARRLAAAGAPADDRGLAALETALHDPSWRVRKAAAARIGAAFPASRIAGMLVRLLGDPSDAGARSAASEALVSLGDAAAPAMLSAWADADARVRKAIFEVLGGGGIARGSDADALLLRGIEDPDANVRVAAVEAAARLQPASLPALLVRGLDDREILVRFAVLSAAPQSRAVPVGRLVDAARDPLLRRSALRALGATGDAAALPPLGEALSDPLAAGWNEALAATVSLAVAHPEAARRAIARAPIDAIVSRLEVGGAEADVAAGAVRILGAAGLAAVSGRDLPMSGLLSLGRAFVEGGPAAEGENLAPTLAALLARVVPGPEGAEARAILAAAAARHGSAAGLALLAAALLDARRDGDEREAALEALRALAVAGGKTTAAVVGWLADALETVTDAGVRADIARVLGAAGASGTSTLRRLSRDPAPRARRAALAALGESGSDDVAWEESTAALEDEESSVRIAALSVAGTIAMRVSKRDAIPLLVRGLADRDLLVRAAAARSLGTSASPLAVAPLLDLPAGGSPLLDLAVVEALGRRSADPRARARLAFYATSPNADVSALAIRLRDDG